jgi:hypothetical protein
MELEMLLVRTSFPCHTTVEMDLGFLLRTHSDIYIYEYLTL